MRLTLCKFLLCMMFIVLTSFTITLYFSISVLNCLDWLLSPWKKMVQVTQSCQSNNICLENSSCTYLRIIMRKRNGSLDLTEQLEMLALYSETKGCQCEVLKNEYANPWNLVVWITSSIEKCIALILKIFFDAGKQNCQNTYYYSLMPNLTLKLEQLNSMKQLHFCNDNKLSTINLYNLWSAVLHFC